MWLMKNGKDAICEMRNTTEDRCESFLTLFVLSCDMVWSDYLCCSVRQYSYGNNSYIWDTLYRSSYECPGGIIHMDRKVIYSKNCFEIDLWILLISLQVLILFYSCKSNLLLYLEYTQNERYVYISPWLCSRLPLSACVEYNRCSLVSPFLLRGSSFGNIGNKYIHHRGRF